MTAVSPFPAAAPHTLTEGERAAGLESLARNLHGLEGPEHAQELARLCHPSLSLERRGELFAAYRDLDARHMALRDGVEHWTGVYPEMTCPGDCQETATELAGDAARELLYLLVNGEDER